MDNFPSPRKLLQVNGLHVSGNCWKIAHNFSSVPKKQEKIKTNSQQKLKKGEYGVKQTKFLLKYVKYPWNNL